MKILKDVCVGCGTCIDACPVNAISLNDGCAEINQEVCVKCGACKDICPVSAITDEE